MSLPNRKMRKQRIILINLPPLPRLDKCKETTNETMQMRSMALKALVRKLSLFGEQINLVTNSHVKNNMVYEFTLDATFRIHWYSKDSSFISSRAASPIHDKIDNIAIVIVKISYT